ncbi:aa3-type cytochrome oxidase subunit CtaJ [Blastococcus sp. SYSU DS0533]
MTVVETLLVYAAIPLAVVLVLALLTLKPGKGRRPRYKPGQAWDYAPVWYEPHPATVGGHGPAAAHGPAAVPGSGTAALGSSVYPEQPGERALDAEGGIGPAGGTGSEHSGSAHSGGAQAGGATAARLPRAAGPLGGARGTW